MAVCILVQSEISTIICFSYKNDSTLCLCSHPWTQTLHYCCFHLGVLSCPLQACAFMSMKSGFIPYFFIKHSKHGFKFQLKWNIWIESNPPFLFFLIYVGFMTIYVPALSNTFLIEENFFHLEDENKILLITLHIGITWVLLAIF